MSALTRGLSNVETVLELGLNKGKHFPSGQTALQLYVVLAGPDELHVRFREVAARKEGGLEIDETPTSTAAAAAVG